MISNQFIQTLLSAPLPTPLLPNLRRLVWHDHRERFYPLLRVFIGSTITFFELGNERLSPSSLALLAFLGGRCPSLRELAFEINDYRYGESLDPICEVLHGLRGLFRLKAGYLTLRELLRLTSLPSLKFLHFGLEDCGYEERHYPTPIIFSQLDQVHITAMSISFLKHCLSNVRFLSCRSVYIDCSDFGGTKVLPYDPLGVPGLILSLSECFSPTLEQLHFHFKFQCFTDERMLANPRFALGYDVVAPLLSFSRLIDLRLDWICTSAIDDASLKTIAQSWPQLETFWFGNAARWVTPPSLSFIGLAHLIHHCRRLHTIGMSFCACQVDIDSEPFSQTIPNENITKLSVGMSPIINPIDVASQLHRFLPKLTYVDFLDWLNDDIPTPLPFQHLEGWDRVNKLLGDCNHY